MHRKSCLLIAVCSICSGYFRQEYFNINE